MCGPRQCLLREQPAPFAGREAAEGKEDVCGDDVLHPRYATPPSPPHPPRVASTFHELCRTCQNTPTCEFTGICHSEFLGKCMGEEARYEGTCLLFDGLQQPVLNKQVGNAGGRPVANKPFRVCRSRFASDCLVGKKGACGSVSCRLHCPLVCFSFVFCLLWSYSADVCAAGHRHSRTFPRAEQGKHMLSFSSIDVNVGFGRVLCTFRPSGEGVTPGVIFSLSFWT